ncbi:MAG: extracellular solute-binding protein [Caldilineaceae bacterium SB0665_bin_25]|nr:extracellular solute-binding protein [Caldilineaceae bacterium SB0665_bin_25]
MPIQRSLRASSEVKPGGSISWRCAPNCFSAPRRLPFQLWLLLLALLLNGCDALPSRPRLPELPFLQLRGESEAAEAPLHVFLPEEGDVTEALRSRVVAWAAASELQVNLTASDQYDQELGGRLAGEDPPDLVLVTGFLFPELASGGLLAPAEQGFLDPADLPPRLAAAFTWPGEEAVTWRYCLPREVRTLALVYDSEGLAAANQPPPASWDALRTVAIGQTDVDRNRFGFIEAPDLSRWLPFLYGAGGTIIDGSGGMALESPAAGAAMDWYIQVFRDNFAGHAGESNNEWAGEVLGKGKGGLTIEGNWIAPYFEAEFPDFQYGVAPLPSGPAGLNTSVAFTSCYAVPSGSSRREDAFELAAILSGPDVVGSLPNDGGWMPALNGIREEWKRRFPRLTPFADAVPTAAVWQLPPGFDTFLHSFNRGMVQLFAANVEAADFFAELQELGETLLETAGEPQPSPAATQDSSP